jgi:hypothetical protein
MLVICDGLLRLMRTHGVPEPCGVGLLRTVIPYGIGFALAELSFQCTVQTSDDGIPRLSTP